MALTQKELDELNGVASPAPSAPTTKELEELNAPKTSVGKAAIMGAGSYASLGLNDELGGVANAAFHSSPVRWLRKVTGVAAPYDGEEVPSTIKEAYTQGRDAVREADKKAAEDQKLAYHGAGIATSVLTAPVSLGRAVSSKLGGKVAARLAGATAEGAAMGLGSSEGDLTKGEVMRVAKDTLTGAAAGAVVGGAGEAVTAGTKKIGEKVRDRLGKRILNEIVDDGETRITGTQVKHLAKTEDPIYKEVLRDADIRKAFQGDASTGRELIAPKIEAVDGELRQAYSVLQKNAPKLEGGQIPFDFNTAAYLNKIDEAREAARVGGKVSVMDAMDAISAKVKDFAAKEGTNGQLTLEQLRGLTTETQRIAASAIGGLNLHMPAELKRKVAAVVTGGMKDALESAAGDNPLLKAAARTISENNERMFALKTIDNALQVKASKQPAAKDIIIQAGRYLGSPALAGGLATTAALTSDEDAAMKAVGLGAAGFLAPRAARWLSREVTTAGIKAAQGNSAIPKVAQSALRTAVQAKLRHDLKKRDDE